MSDRFDTDPDDIIEPDDPASKYEDRFDTEPSVPEASVPEPPTVGSSGDTESLPDYEDVDPELRKIFWKLVFVIKFSLLSLTLGALFFTFEGRTELGGQLLAFGLVLTGYGIYQYRQAKARIEEGDFDTPEEPTGEDTEPTTPEQKAAAEADESDEGP